MDIDPRWLSEPFDDVRPPLQMQMVATDRNVSLARRRLRDWLTADVSPELVEDLVLAVYEAMTNAVEHGYADCPHGPVRLQARRSSAHLQITVSDDGSWRVPTDDRFRGRGLPLIRLLADDVHIAAGPDGTVVRLWAEAPYEGLAHLRSRPAARRATSLGPPAAK
jgi:anti-sigma regulatory factor (Ser/Thr protein kinase)